MVFCFVLFLVWFGFFLSHSFANATERALLRKDEVKSTKKKDSGNYPSALYCYSE